MFKILLQKMIDNIMRFIYFYKAGSFQRQYREGQRSGLPTPILRVANVFTIDGEGIRYGRMYRTAGYHAHTLIWYVHHFKKITRD